MRCLKPQAKRKAMFEKIVVIGAGKMGSALVDGWLASGTPAASVYLIDPAFADKDLGWPAKNVAVYAGVPQLLAADDRLPDLVMLAIKPQMMATALPALSVLDHGGLTVLSVAAGTTLGTLQTAFPQAVCVRTMPNTPAAVGQGITAAFAPKADTDLRDGVSALLQAVGQVVWVEAERDIDAVTAVSGSGPAYVFHMVEALAQAGVAAGLPAETAMQLARQTIVGAGALLAASEDSAEQLRVNVTSPHGTTAAGLAVLQGTGRLADLMTETVKAAYDRSVALAAK